MNKLSISIFLAIVLTATVVYIKQSEKVVEQPEPVAVRTEQKAQQMPKQIVLPPMDELKPGESKKLNPELVRLINAKKPGSKTYVYTNTSISPVMDVNLQFNKNTFYIASFRLAWEKLIKNVIKAPIQLESAPQLALKLNNSLGAANDIAPNAYFAIAGFYKDDIIGKINAGMMETFGYGPKADLSLSSPMDILAYSYMAKDLKFFTKFEDVALGTFYDENGKEFAKKGFGFITEFDSTSQRHKDIAKHVIINYYKNKDNFVLTILPKGNMDKIIIARLPKQATLAQMVKSALHYTAYKTEGLKTDDKLFIPEVLLDYTQNYKDLEGKKILNKGFEDAVISKAIQTVRFKMDYEGVKVEGETVIHAYRSAGSPIETRDFIVDGPFLVMMQEKGKTNPYFAAWIANDEVLLN